MSSIAMVAYQGQYVNPCVAVATVLDPALMRKSGDLIRAIDLEGIPSAAERLGVSRQMVHKYLRTDVLDYYQFGKRRMVHKRDVDKLIEVRSRKAS